MSVTIPSVFHERVPRGLRANLAFRRRMLSETQTSAHARRLLMEACRRDVVFWIKAFVWQFNPKPVGTMLVDGPFVPYEFQEEAIREVERAIVDQEDLIIEKSRDMGVSWIVLLVYMHRWLFMSNQKFLCISRDESQVDKRGEPDSLFWKIDYAMQNMPVWMLPKNWGGRGKDRLKLRFINKEKGNNLTGTATTGSASVGGRATSIFPDEYAQIQEARELRRATAGSTRCRIFVSTHLGLDTEFYRMTQQSDLRKLQVHWIEHPEKRRGLYSWDQEKNTPRYWRYDPKAKQLSESDYPDIEFPVDYMYAQSGRPTGGPYPGIRSQWYDKECSRIGDDRGVAMDLDIDPRGSDTQAFDAVMVERLVLDNCVPPYWEGEAVLSPDGLELTECPGGSLKLWTYLKDGKPPQSTYAAGADIGGGVDKNPSVLSIVNCENGEKVLEMANTTMQPRPCAFLFVALCQLFRNSLGEPAKFAWDANGPLGAYFSRAVMETEFRNWYLPKNEDVLHGEATRLPGWRGGRREKVVLFMEYFVSLKERKFINRSEAAMRELHSFRRPNADTIEHALSKNDRDPAQSGENHGDRPQADALASKMMKMLNVSSDVPDAAIPGTDPTEPVHMSIEWFRWRRKRMERKNDLSSEIW